MNPRAAPGSAWHGSASQTDNGREKSWRIGFSFQHRRGANPNTQDLKGQTPLMVSVVWSLGAALHLLQRVPDIDVNVRTTHGSTLLGGIRATRRNVNMNTFPELRDDASAKRHVLAQLNEIEAIIVARDAHDGGWHAAAEGA